MTLIDLDLINTDTAAVAQWLERLPHEWEVEGSIPDHVIPKTL